MKNKTARKQLPPGRGATPQGLLAGWHVGLADAANELLREQQNGHGWVKVEGMASPKDFDLRK
ncbi:hypothetical protein LZ009_05525 [Ramlibacter sp. XY19]|uniref:hypothetical protein n=1 Tax=Ramlibacter paludis TaxID=2908000 RepID=UPI0023DBCAA6|nr:hypothetical protein [Ramlibacter paludis]MCG2592237.1 hypothetical protein [Ramlibacter paludis]